MSGGDAFVTVILVVVGLWWGGLLFKRWVTSPRALQTEIDVDPEIPVTEAVALLESSGYEVMTLKRKIPITIMLDDATELQSRLFVDHFARQGEDLYVVKLARERKPLELTGSGIRDQLLAYTLLYKEAAGILYVDAASGKIHKIQMEVDR